MSTSTPHAITGARLDHVVIGVRDLTESAAALTEAGLVPAGGGEHDGRGTANALFALAHGYLELITVTDAAVARAHSPNRAQVADALDAAPVTPLGYALSVPDVAAAAAGLTDAGQQTQGPVDMSRQNPGGERLTWRNLYVGPTQWQTPWPFLITWDSPHDLSGGSDHPRVSALSFGGGAKEAATAAPGYELLGGVAVAPNEFALVDIRARWPHDVTGLGLQHIELRGGALGRVPQEMAHCLAWE